MSVPKLSKSIWLALAMNAVAWLLQCAVIIIGHAHALIWVWFICTPFVMVFLYRSGRGGIR